MKFYDDLKNHYPRAKISLTYKSAWELLVATILSAQCTDERVNKVTKKLFKKYKKLDDYIKVSIEELEQDVKSTGFYRNKAKSIQESAKLIKKDFDGKVPNKMNDLLTLRGVARKTANVVLGAYFKKFEGVVVDTHVKRISFRLGYTKNTNPEKVEQDLMKQVPNSDWSLFSLILIDHGRVVCKAPNPICSECFLNKNCPRNGVTKFK